MSEPEQADDTPKKKSKLPLLIGLVLALALGGGGFFAVYSGMLFAAAGEGAEAHGAEPEIAPMPEVAFVAVTPLIVSLGPGGSAQHLRFSAQLEVPKAEEEEVAVLMPRVLDVLNGYLRAVDVKELEDPAALIRLRAQMLRRVQIVTGEGRVRDFLVTEFVLN